MLWWVLTGKWWLFNIICINLISKTRELNLRLIISHHRVIMWSKIEFKSGRNYQRLQSYFFVKLMTTHQVFVWFYQKHIYNPVKHLIWSVFKKIHLRYLTGFCIRLWLLEDFSIINWGCYFESSKNLFNLKSILFKYLEQKFPPSIR